jgi:poly(3-hydroxybutyrate) depolymerase
MLKAWLCLGLSLGVVACSASPGAGPDSALDGAFDGALGDAAPSSIVIKTNVKLGSHPQLMDIYGAAAPTRVVVFLHGGGGNKETIAEQLGLRVLNGATVATDAAWLTAHNVAFVFPQGQAHAGSNGFTWSNYVMSSDVDDVGFLNDLARAIRSGTLLPGLAATARVVIAGHSNGGMMANRMWCEASATFDAFVAFAGPASEELTKPTHLCAPTVAKPYLGFVGAKDSVLQTTGNWLVDIWRINSVLANTPGFVNPAVVNELTFHSTVRVKQKCDGTTAAPVDTRNGATTEWHDCSDTIRLVRVNNAGHCVAKAAEGTGCPVSLETGTGARPIDSINDFVTAVAP